MHQHIQLIKRAKSLGVQVKDVSDIMDTAFAVFEYQGISELVREGVPTSWINVRSQFYCDNKQLAKLAYENLNIPHPKSITFQSANQTALISFLQKEKKYVCKPLDGTNGIGVWTDIRTIEEVKAYYKNNKDLATTFMLEEQIEGDDLRIHVLGGKIVAACIRQPAFVIGNGVDTLKILIENRRYEMQIQNPNNFLEVDKSTLDLLEQQEISLTDIPKLDCKIQLKKVSNIAQGGIVIDVTDEIHPIYHQWVSGLVDYLKTGYFGLDLITKNHAANPIENTNVLEMNARADWLHHTFSQHKTHDIAGMILKELFELN